VAHDHGRLALAIDGVLPEAVVLRAVAYRALVPVVERRAPNRFLNTVRAS